MICPTHHCKLEHRGNNLAHCPMNGCNCTKKEVVDMEQLKFEPMEGGSFDPTEFEGKKYKIAGMEIVEVKSKYDPATGKEMADGQTTMVKRLRVFTEQISTTKNREGNETPVVASELFSIELKEDGTIQYSNAPRANLNLLLKKVEVATPEELVDKEVMVVSRKNFLGFNYK